MADGYGEHSPEFWTDRAAEGVLAASRAAADATAHGPPAWERVAVLVEGLAAEVTAAHPEAVRAAAAAKDALACAAGVTAEWGKVRPMVTHLRRLATGGVAAGMFLLPVAVTPEPAGVRICAPPDPVAAERAARDLPERERYAALARLSLDRGDHRAAEWFAHKAAGH